jgi:hypothetical protein
MSLTSDGGVDALDIVRRRRSASSGHAAETTASSAVRATTPRRLRTDRLLAARATIPGRRRRGSKTWSRMAGGNDMLTRENDKTRDVIGCGVGLKT